MKNAILTDEQRRILDIKPLIPSYAQDKALNDKEIWDLSQLEKVFTIQKRSFDPEDQILSFVVITKRKWTEKEQKADAKNWAVGEKEFVPAVKVIGYNKHEEQSFILTAD